MIYKIDIVVTNVTIEISRNRKLSTLIFERVITKGNDFQTMLKFIKLKKIYKDFKPETDRVIKIDVVKKVGETSVINN